MLTTDDLRQHYKDALDAFTLATNTRPTTPNADEEAAWQSSLYSARHTTREKLVAYIVRLFADNHATPDPGTQLHESSWFVEGMELSQCLNLALAGRIIRVARTLDDADSLDWLAEAVTIGLLEYEHRPRLKAQIVTTHCIPSLKLVRMSESEKQLATQQMSYLGA